jgi:hypothetical protein
MDLESDIMALETESVTSDRQSMEGNSPWRGYPQSLFGNWVGERVKRCKMVENCSKDPREKCRIYYVDVLKDGKFKPAAEDNVPLDVDERALGQLWDTKLQTKVRAIRSLLQPN